VGRGRGGKLDLAERQQVIAWIDEAGAAGARRDQACAVLGLTLRSVQRWREAGGVKVDGRQAATQHRTPAHALSPAERAAVLAVVNRPEWADQSPKQIVPRLADQGKYLASESTIYRLLRAESLLAHRGKAKPATQRRPAPVVATGPNQVWTWDITYLATPVRGTFFYLYLILDLFSRQIVGWEVHAQESAAAAAHLFRATYLREAIDGEALVLHSDNGAPMKGATMLATLQRLGVVPSFSRPAVSNDNPYSEALFRTVKYTPAYPEGPFASLAAARAWVADFVPWYNEAHYHSGIRFVTPGQRHRGEEGAVLQRRTAVYETARRQHPIRWANDIRNWQPVGPVSLNPGKSSDQEASNSNKAT
jgi:putative transposase